MGPLAQIPRHLMRQSQIAVSFETPKLLNKDSTLNIDYISKKILDQLNEKPPAPVKSCFPNLKPKKN